MNSHIRTIIVDGRWIAATATDLWLPNVSGGALKGRIGPLEMDSFSLAAGPADKCCRHGHDHLLSLYGHTTTTTASAVVI